MAQGRRVDPVQILIRVGDTDPDTGGNEEAYQEWVYLAREAGWDVVESPGFQEPGDGGTQCGLVEIEGLAYRVHYGLRARLDLADGETVLTYAAWAEPVR
ncbi:hypothetical protein [Streptomyces lavendofoliae]|uniref:Uncharacterized protein n=1 Tax=Streptomyces lavendofoliae TaxID=67314 RepID=A0A918HWE1_9ACTN|nr:hypothetical protein [Streptomyces lavendofoliae]GGU35986.1 hypothetical protein GCM10010274_24150 [Streptomyces lavendofoliae]